mmetsp:Transcript_7993/g.19688  ORF Transcript_7993/g.19688 Transcript_7993/m.19688 type:complete len:229 (+) Transcript_7993:2076-2762(+)
MSSESRKMLSRYIHLRWTCIQWSNTSPMVDSDFSHFLIRSMRGAAKREAVMLCSCRMWSSSSVLSSSLALRTYPRSSDLYLEISKVKERHVDSILPMFVSSLSSSCASWTISCTSSGKRCSCMSKTVARVNFFMSMSESSPANASSRFQCCGRMASCLSFSMSGTEFLKDVMTSSNLRNVTSCPSSGWSFGSLRIFLSNPSTAFERACMSTLDQFWLLQSLTAVLCST